MRPGSIFDEFGCEPCLDAHDPFSRDPRRVRVEPSASFLLPDLPFYAIETARHSISVVPILGLCVASDPPRLIMG